MNWQWKWQRDRQEPERQQHTTAFQERTPLQETSLPAFATSLRLTSLPTARVPPRIPCPTLGMP